MLGTHKTTPTSQKCPWGLWLRIRRRPFINFAWQFYHLNCHDLESIASFLLFNTKYTLMMYLMAFKTLALFEGSGMCFYILLYISIWYGMNSPAIHMREDPFKLRIKWSSVTMLNTFTFYKIPIFLNMKDGRSIKHMHEKSDIVYFLFWRLILNRLSFCC